MGKYVVIRKFKDTDGKVYEGGDFYPQEGLELNEERAAELVTGNNKTGKIYIVEVVQQEEKAAEDEEKAEEKKEKKPKAADKKTKK